MRVGGFARRGVGNPRNVIRSGRNHRRGLHLAAIDDPAVMQDSSGQCKCLLCAGSSEELSDAEARSLAVVKRHGWQVLKIEADDEGPSQAFSIGLYHSFRHPEIVIFGLPTGLMHNLINEIGEHVRAGACFEDGQTDTDLLADYDVRFRRVAPEEYPDHLGWATWFYNSHPFPVLQVVWPDKQHRYPWDAGTAEGFRQLQPVVKSPSPTD